MNALCQTQSHAKMAQFQFYDCVAALSSQQGSCTVQRVIVCFLDVLYSNVTFGLLVRSSPGVFLPYQSWFKSLLEKGLL